MHHLHVKNVHWYTWQQVRINVVEQIRVTFEMAKTMKVKPEEWNFQFLSVFQVC